MYYFMYSTFIFIILFVSKEYIWFHRPTYLHPIGCLPCGKLVMVNFFVGFKVSSVYFSMKFHLENSL
jgi:hypothetical protein